MKVIGEAGREVYVCIVSREEIEKFMNLYYGHMKAPQLGDVIDLGKGYNFLSEVKAALRSTQELIKTHRDVIKAITEGIMIMGREADN